MINFIIGLFKKKKSFRCGGESRIWFKGSGGEESYIYYRQPTGDEILSFIHSNLANEETELKKVGTEINFEKLHLIARRKKFIPAAKLIITRWEGYEDEEGKEAKDIDFLEKYFPHHLESVAIYGYAVNDKSKKKD